MCDTVGIIEQRAAAGRGHRGRDPAAGPAPHNCVEVRLLAAAALAEWLAARPGIERLRANGEGVTFLHAGDAEAEAALLRAIVEAGFRVVAFGTQAADAPKRLHANHPGGGAMSQQYGRVGRAQRAPPLWPGYFLVGRTCIDPPYRFGRRSKTSSCKSPRGWCNEPTGPAADSGRPGGAGSRHAPASAIGRLLRLVGDRLNPILVKETRQALKSKQFTITFGLLLIAVWAWTILGVAFIGPGLS